MQTEIQTYYIFCFMPSVSLPILVETASMSLRDAIMTQTELGKSNNPDRVQLVCTNAPDKYLRILHESILEFVDNDEILKNINGSVL